MKGDCFLCKLTFLSVDIYCKCSFSLKEMIQDNLFYILNMTIFMIGE